MAKFTDSKGTSWRLDLNVGLLEDAKKETGIDLDSITDDANKLAGLILSNPRKLVEFLYVLCEEQIVESGLDAKEFGRRFNRETLDRAGDALVEAIVDFYPRSSAGKVIRENLPRLLADMDQRIGEATKKSIDQQLLKSHTDMLGQSGLFRVG